MTESTATPPTSREPYYVDWQNRLPRDLFPGVRITVVSGEKLMLSRVEIAPGAVIPDHQHPHEQFGHVMDGGATFTIGGETRLLRAGDYYAIPGGVLHSVTGGERGATCMDIFAPPREEYR